MRLLFAASAPGMAQPLRQSSMPVNARRRDMNAGAQGAP
jgi:hypothetical protein